MAAPNITFAAAAGQIDAASGVIRGVSLITEGPALGHGVMIDAKTDATSAECETPRDAARARRRAWQFLS